MSQMYQRLVIVGVGLIGGSIGLAAKKRGLAQSVLGVVRSESSGKRALACGTVDEITSDVAAAMAGADVAVVCTPVGSLAESVLKVLDCCEPATLVTDGGSTKEKIIRQVEAEQTNLGSRSFVGSHPLAGDHRTGPEAAREDLLADKLVVVTPSTNTSEETTERAEQFWQALGAHTTCMSPAEHDAALAKTSHVPHLIAAALAAATPEDALRLAGTGWRDTTRVASGDPSLWRDIFLHNSESVLAGLDSAEAMIAQFRHAIAGSDTQLLEDLLGQGKTRRDAVGS